MSEVVCGKCYVRGECEPQGRQGPPRRAAGGISRTPGTHAAGGTLAYRGPETFSGQYNTASEVYSYSIVLHDLITGGCKQLELKKDKKSGRGDLVFDSAAMRN